MELVIIMKKILSALLALFLVFGLTGCSSSSSSAESHIEIQEGVRFELLDVLRVSNHSSNTIYYYFLASVSNNSDEVYHMSNLEYVITDDGSQESINPIERFQTTITNNVNSGVSTFVYGYIGYPNAKEKNAGLRFPKNDAFIPFSSVKIRDINDDNVQNSSEKKFTVYEDDYFSFEVDAENVEYSYADGNSYVKSLKITYTNKTDSRLVVPYLTPVCTMDGLKLENYAKGESWKSMSLEELRKQDFKVNNLPPKTESFTGEATGYQVFYLSAEQSLTTPVDFTFPGEIPDFSSDPNTGLTINITSPALGYSQVIRVVH